MPAALSKFLPEVLIDCPGAPDPQVDRQVRHAAIELCDFALVWRVDLAAQDIVADTSEYAIDSSPDGRVVTVIYASHDGIQLEPATERQLDDNVEGWRAASNTSTQPEWYYLPDRETIRLALTPDKAVTDGLKVSVALKPKQDAESLPDILYDDYLEAIGCGAKARLLAMSGRPWADPQTAQYYKREFERLKHKHKAERLNDFTRESTYRVRPINYYG